MMTTYIVQIDQVRTFRSQLVRASLGYAVARWRQRIVSDSTQYSIAQARGRTRVSLTDGCQECEVTIDPGSDPASTVGTTPASPHEHACVSKVSFYVLLLAFPDDQITKLRTCSRKCEALQCPMRGPTSTPPAWRSDADDNSVITILSHHRARDGTRWPLKADNYNDISCTVRQRYRRNPLCTLA